MAMTPDSGPLFDTPINAFKREGAFLLAAERAADLFRRRIFATSGPIKLGRDEALALSDQFERVVSICRGYHLDAAKPSTPNEPAA